jgi:hypothetical protein
MRSKKYVPSRPAGGEGQGEGAAVSASLNNNQPPQPACGQVLLQAWGRSGQFADGDIKADYTEDLKKILGSLNVASKEWIIRQYDHEVQAGSVIKPLVGINNDGPSDAAVVRPDLTSSEASSFPAASIRTLAIRILTGWPHPRSTKPFATASPLERIQTASRSSTTSAGATPNARKLSVLWFEPPWAVRTLRWLTAHRSSVAKTA